MEDDEAYEMRMQASRAAAEAAELLTSASAALRVLSEGNKWFSLAERLEVFGEHTLNASLRIGADVG